MKHNLKFLDNEIPNIIEGFENNKTNIFELEKVIPLTKKYTIHYNIYNVTFLISLIFLISFNLSDCVKYKNLLFLISDDNSSSL